MLLLVENALDQNSESSNIHLQPCHLKTLQYSGLIYTIALQLKCQNVKREKETDRGTFKIANDIPQCDGLGSIVCPTIPVPSSFSFLSLVFTAVIQILIETERYRYINREGENKGERREEEKSQAAKLQASLLSLIQPTSLLPSLLSYICPSFAFSLSPLLHSLYIHPLLQPPFLYLCEQNIKSL